MRPLLALFLLFAATVAFGQDNVPPTVKVVPPKSARPGSKVVVVIELSFDEGLHGYANPPTEDYQIPVKVSLDPRIKAIKVLKVTYPKGVPATMAGETKPSMVYQGTVRIPVTIQAPAKPGSFDLPFVVDYQQCNEQNCYPPAKVDGKAKLIVKK